ncbi:MAG: helix-turn-helix domain-containing protein [Bacillota bacterium]|nr:helix-turn-helix domain-containing protein [Bacillota bacterium]
MNRLAQKIKDARIKAKMTEKELAAKAGIQLSYLLQVESGKKVINEQMAEKILSVMGEEIQFITEDQPVPEKTKVKVAPAREAMKPITPNAQWESVLAGVIQKYPVTGESSGKVLDYKELSIVHKKIDGIHFEKIMFVKVEQADLPGLRIKKGDVISLHMMNTVENDSIYYLEVGGIRQIRMVRMDSNRKLQLLTGINDHNPQVFNPVDVKVIGKCIKVEFFL